MVEFRRGGDDVISGDSWEVFIEAWLIAGRDSGCVYVCGYLCVCVYVLFSLSLSLSLFLSHCCC